MTVILVEFSLELKSKYFSTKKFWETLYVRVFINFVSNSVTLRNKILFLNCFCCFRSINKRLVGDPLLPEKALLKLLHYTKVRNLALFGAPIISQIPSYQMKQTCFLFNKRFWIVQSWRGGEELTTRMGNHPENIFSLWYVENFGVSTKKESKVYQFLARKKMIRERRDWYFGMKKRVFCLYYRVTTSLDPCLKVKIYSNLSTISQNPFRNIIISKILWFYH